MAKIYIDMTDDEQYCNGNLPIRVESHDNLSGNDSALLIGEEIELVLSVPQMITLFDVLDGWLHGGPIKGVGDIERRVKEAIKEVSAEHGGAVRAMNSKPEVLAHIFYEALKFHGLRFRIHGGNDIAEEPDTLAKRHERFRKKRECLSRDDSQAALDGGKG